MHLQKLSIINKWKIQNLTSKNLNIKLKSIE